MSQPADLRVASPEPGELAHTLERPDDDQTLVDLLDRVIERGVIVTGDVVLSVAGVDLVHLELRLALRGVVEGPVW